MTDDLLHGDWDTDTDEVPETEHNPKCTCDDCLPNDETGPLPEYDITHPLYHAPNRCFDANCDYEQCQPDDGAHEEEFPGERIWWRTAPTFEAVLEQLEEIRNKTK